MGGDLTARCEPGEMVFELTLPRADSRGGVRSGTHGSMNAGLGIVSQGTGDSTETAQPGLGGIGKRC
jgi:hypothetical protein